MVATVHLHAVSPFWVIQMRLMLLCCTLVVEFLSINALGPIPEGVTVSPNGCQSLQVTWTPRAPTPPLTLIHYRVRYRPTQGGFDQDAFIPSSESSYTITGLAPATMYTVEVRAQTELGYGGFCCTPMVSTNNGKVPSAARGHMPTPCSYTICTANSAPLAVHGPH